MKSSKETTCCFSGYRPAKLPWRDDETDAGCVRLKKALSDVIEAVYHDGYRHFICGMAQGSDFLFCEAVIGLRNAYPDMTLEAAIPCETQAEKWPEAQRSRYFRLVSECDTETLIQYRYTPDCMRRRNQYMVDHSDLLIAVFDGMAGGTMQTVTYAIKQGLRVIEIKP